MNMDIINNNNINNFNHNNMINNIISMINNINNDNHINNHAINQYLNDLNNDNLNDLFNNLNNHDINLLINNYDFIQNIYNVLNNYDFIQNIYNVHYNNNLDNNNNLDINNYQINNHINNYINNQINLIQAINHDNANDADAAAGGEIVENAAAGGGVVAFNPVQVVPVPAPRTDVCSICFVDIDIGTDCIVTNCDHMFHHECINPWIANHNTCPNCRNHL